MDGYPELELLLARVMVGRATARRVETYLAAVRAREGRKWPRGTRARSRTPYMGLGAPGGPQINELIDMALWTRDVQRRTTLYRWRLGGLR